MGIGDWAQSPIPLNNFSFIINQIIINKYHNNFKLKISYFKKYIKNVNNCYKISKIGLEF